MRVWFLIFGWSLLTVPAVAAPPTCALPPEIAGEPVNFIQVKAQTDGKWVRYVTLDPGLAVFPSNLLTDKTVTVVVASKPGRYRILAYAGNEDGGAEAITTLVIGNAPVVPPKDPPDKPTDPVDPPKPVGTEWLVIVRPSDAPSEEFARSLRSPAWDEHRKAGRKIKEMTVAESATVLPPGSLPGGTVLPCVVRLTDDGKKSVVTGGPVPYPTTDDGIKALFPATKGGKARE